MSLCKKEEAGMGVGHIFGHGRSIPSVDYIWKLYARDIKITNRYRIPGRLRAPVWKNEKG
jgi:hypothetical protein